MNFPELIEIPIWIDVSRKESEPALYAKSVAHINPISVSSFYTSITRYENEEKSTTTLVVAGIRFQVRMSYKEFCEFWENTEKSIKMEEPLF